MAWIHRFTRLIGPAALLMGMAIMTACAATSSTTTTTAAACPTTQATALTTITGTVAKIANDTLTIKDAAGSSSTVLRSATTRYTKLQPVAAATLTAGTVVQVLTQPSTSSAPTAAQSIIVQPTTTGQGTGTGGFGQGGAGGFGQGGGAGSFGRGQGGGTFANCRPTTTGLGFRGLSGTVKIYNATSQQLVITDAQGTPFLIAITATTTIGSVGQGSQADVQPGATVIIRATTTNGSITARQIEITSAGPGQ